MTLSDIVEALEAQGVDVRKEFWSGQLDFRKVFIHVAGSNSNRPLEEIRVDEDGDVIIEIPA